MEVTPVEFKRDEECRCGGVCVRLTSALESMMNTQRRFVVASLALVLVAAGCSSDDVTEVSTKSSQTAVSTTAGTESPGSTDGAGTTPGNDGAADNEANFDSFRGVSADAIRVGVTVADFDALQAAGLQNYQGDSKIAFGAFFDDINAAGGIHGRMIEPVYVGFDFVQAVSQEQACLELTEDTEVFIVLYGLLSDSNICLTGSHDTMVMTDQFQTTALREQSGDTLWLQLKAADDEAVEILGSVIAESGRLDGKTIGILANAALNNGRDGEVLRDRLADFEIDSTVEVVTETTQDIEAQRAELGVLGERFIAGGVDFVFDLLGGGNARKIFADIGFDPAFAYSNLPAAVDGAADPILLDGAVTVDARPPELFWEDQDFRSACVEPILKYHPDLAAEFAKNPTGEEQAAGARSWPNPTRIACNQTKLLKALGEIAGADLTNDSFRAALDELGPIKLHGYGRATYTAESKWDGVDEFYIQQYDATANAIEVVGDPIITDR